jgi:YfiH family protein
VKSVKEQHLKSDFQYDTLEKIALLPNIFSSYPEILSGMSTKLGSTNQTHFGMNLSFQVGDDPAMVEMNRKAFLSLFKISESQLAVPVQSHSDNVCIVTAPGEYRECDALITNRTGIALSVMVADCVPILIFDPIEKAIGIVHAGWRGTANAIVQRTIEKMQKEFNTDTKNILASIGPSAGACCYEVGPEVAVMFGNKIVHSNAQKIFVDLKKENAVQLEEKGVIPDHIEMSKHCTICEKELFHSFRRERKSAGRMMAVIYLKP